MKRTRYFQWIDGELSGRVETLNDITCIDGEYFYNFAGGEACNMRYIARMTNSPASLVGKAMVEIVSPQDPWVASVITTKKYTNAGTDETVDIPPIEDITSKTTSGTGQSLNISQSAVGTKKYMPPRFSGPFVDLPSIDEYLRVEPVRDTASKLTPEPVSDAVTCVEIDSMNVTPASASDIQESISVKQITTDTIITDKPQSDGPVAILAKTCKKHSTDINITVTMDLPSRAVFNMVSEEFENGGTEFIDCLISNLDVNNVIDSIKSALVVAYSNDNV